MTTGITIRGIRFRQLLARLKARENLSGMALSRRVGLSQGTISKYENGQRREPDGPTLEKVQRALRLDPAYWVHGEMDAPDSEVDYDEWTNGKTGPAPRTAPAGPLPSAVLDYLAEGRSAPVSAKERAALAVFVGQVPDASQDELQAFVDALRESEKRRRKKDRDSGERLAVALPGEHQILRGARRP